MERGAGVRRSVHESLAQNVQATDLRALAALICSGELGARLNCEMGVDGECISGCREGAECYSASN